VARRSSARRADRTARTGTTAPGRRARPAPEWRLLLLLPALLACVSYLPTLSYRFVGDDVTFIQLNPPSQQLGSLGQSLARGYGWVPGGGDRVDEYRYFRPFIVVDNTLDWVLSGGSPWLFHLANVLTHALAVAMLIWLARRLGVPAIAAAWIGTIFAVHPVQSEAVAWVSGRCDLSAALFGLLCLALVVEWRHEPQRKTLAGTAAGALFLALASKESAFSIVALLPCVLLVPLADRRDTRPARGGAGGILLPLGIAFAVYMVWRVAVLGAGAAGGLGRSGMFGLDRGDIGQRLLLSGNLLLLYLKLLAVPWPLSLGAPSSVAKPPYPAVAGSLGLLLFLAAGALWLYAVRLAVRHGPASVPGRFGTPAALCGAGLFLLGLLPTMQWIPTGEPYGERFLYLPFAGFLLLVGGLIGDWLAQRPARAWATLALVGVPCLVLLQTHLPAWRDELTFLEYTVRVRPESAPSRANLARALMERGRLAEAVTHAAKGYALDPKDWRVAGQYGAILINTGRTDEGTAVLERLYAAGLRAKNLLLDLGIGRLRQNRYPEAEELLLQAQRLAPGDPAVLDALAMAERKLGRYDEADRLWRRALEIDPNRENCYRNLFGLHYFDRRDPVTARQWGERFLARFPNATGAQETRYLMQNPPLAP
jgi:Flp pilus assembly protein TadD